MVSKFLERKESLDGALKSFADMAKRETKRFVDDIEPMVKEMSEDQLVEFLDSDNEKITDGDKKLILTKYIRIHGIPDCIDGIAIILSK